MLQADSRGSSVDPKGAGGPVEIQESGGESSTADRESQGDAAVDQSADALQKGLSFSGSEPGSLTKDTTQPGPSNKSNRQDTSSNNKEDTAKTKQPPLDQNGNMETRDKARQSKQKGKNEEGQKQTVTPAPKLKMVFGPQKTVVLIIFQLMGIEKLKP